MGKPPSTADSMRQRLCKYLLVTPEYNVLGHQHTTIALRELPQLPVCCAAQTDGSRMKSLKSTPSPRTDSRLAV